MVKRLILFLFLFANSCGTINIGWVDPELKPYLARFKEDAMLQRVTPNYNGLTIKFVSQEGKDVGVCYRRDLWNTIEIDPKAWFRFDALDREQLVYHELGHCALNREHCNYSNTWGPVSMMGSVMMFSYTYSDNHDYYITELFHPAKECIGAQHED